MKINTGRVDVQQDLAVKAKPKKAPNMNYLRDKDRELVKGVFNFHEQKGGVLKFAFRKYKGDPIAQYSLKDGEVYSLPRAVARHLNTSGRYATHEFALSPDGKSRQKISKTTNRYGFNSLEFTDFEDEYQDKESNILKVEEIK